MEPSTTCKMWFESATHCGVEVQKWDGETDKKGGEGKLGLMKERKRVKEKKKAKV